MEREIERIFFRSRADNRAEVIGEKRGEEGGSRARVARERRWRKKTRPAAAAAAAPWGGHGWGGGDGDGRRGGAEEEGEGISASSISLFDVRPAPNSAVRATLSKWLGGHQRKCLGTTPPPVLLRLLTKPYRYSVLYRHSRLTFFPGRERERERGERVFRLSAFPTFPRKEGKRAKGEGGREGGKKGRGKLCRPREKRESKNLGELFFDRVFLRFVINIPPSFFCNARVVLSFFFKFFFPTSPKFLALQRDA